MRAYYSDYVTDATGHAVAGALVALYPATLFAPGAPPTDVPASPALATATTDVSGRFVFRDLPPDDYHVLVRYTPPGGVAQTGWRYDVAVAPAAEVARATEHDLGGAAPRTLAKLLGGLPVTILCVGDGVTVGYNATGTVGGGWVARLAARLAAALPAATVARYDPKDYAATLDAPIASWTPVPIPPPGGSTGMGNAGVFGSGQPIGVINAGVTGDTVLAALRRFANFSAAAWNPPPDCYVVDLGLVESGSDPARAATPADLAGQLTGLVNRLRAGGAEVVLCTPHREAASLQNGLPAGSYAAAVRGVAAATGCGLVDLYALWQGHLDAGAPNGGYGAWLDTTAGDVTDPTDAGHAAIGDEVFRVFDPAGALPVRGPLGVGARWEEARILNTSALLTYTGAWTAHTGFALFELLASPREMRAATPGDRLTFSARCSELYMLCRRWHDGGQVRVTIDGADYGVVDLYRASPASTVNLTDPEGALAPQDRVPLALGLSDAPHSVTLQLMATTNPAARDAVALRRAGDPAAAPGRAGHRGGRAARAATARRGHDRAGRRAQRRGHGRLPRPLHGRGPPDRHRAEPRPGLLHRRRPGRRDGRHDHARPGLPRRRHRHAGRQLARVRVGHPSCLLTGPESVLQWPRSYRTKVLIRKALS